MARQPGLDRHAYLQREKKEIALLHRMLDELVDESEEELAPKPRRKRGEQASPAKAS